MNKQTGKRYYWHPHLGTRHERPPELGPLVVPRESCLTRALPRQACGLCLRLCCGCFFARSMYDDDGGPSDEGVTKSKLRKQMKEMHKDMAEARTMGKARQRQEKELAELGGGSGDYDDDEEEEDYGSGGGGGGGGGCGGGTCCRRYMAIIGANREREGGGRGGGGRGGGRGGRGGRRKLKRAMSMREKVGIPRHVSCCEGEVRRRAAG